MNELIMINMFDEIHDIVSKFEDVSNLQENTLKEKIFRSVHGSSHAKHDKNIVHLTYSSNEMQKYRIKKNIINKGHKIELFNSWPGTISPLVSIYRNNYYTISGISLFTWNREPYDNYDISIFGFLRYRTACLLGKTSDEWIEYYSTYPGSGSAQYLIVENSKLHVLEQLGTKITNKQMEKQNNHIWVGHAVPFSEDLEKYSLEQKGFTFSKSSRFIPHNIKIQSDLQTRLKDWLKSIYNPQLLANYTIINTTNQQKS